MGVIDQVISGVRRMGNKFTPDSAGGVAGSGAPLSPGEQAYVGKPNPQYLDGSSPGLSREAADFKASRAAEMGPRTPVGFTPEAAPLDAEGLGRAAGQRVRTALGPASAGIRSAAPAIAGGALAVAPAYHAITDEDNGLSFADRAQLSARALMQGAGGIVGGAAGGTLGSGVGPVGTVAGGVAGGVAGMKVGDAIAGGIRRGANAVNGALGGDPNYWRDSDEIMQSAGYNPNPSLGQMLTGNPRQATPAVAAPVAATGTAPVAAPVKENPYGGIEGIEGVTKDGILSLRNTAPASAENQQFQARANAAGLRAGDLAALPAAQRNIARREQDLDRDAATIQTAFANKAAAEAAAAKGIDEFTARQSIGSAGMGGVTRAGNPGSALDSMLNGSQGAVAMQVAAGLKEAQDRNATAVQNMNTQNATMARGQDMQAATTRENNAAVRAQTRAQMDQTAMYKNLELQRQEKEFGFKQQENDEKVRKEMTDQTMKRIEGMVKPTGNEDVDKQRVAQYQAALPAYVDQIKGRLRNELQKNPGNKAAASALAGFEARGVGHLDEDELNKFMAGMEFNEKAQEYGTSALNPVGGRAAQTRGPALSIKRVPQLWGDLYVDEATGASVPARAIDSDGSFIGGVRNTRFNSLK